MLIEHQERTWNIIWQKSKIEMLSTQNCHQNLLLNGCHHGGNMMIIILINFQNVTLVLWETVAVGFLCWTCKRNKHLINYSWYDTCNWWFKILSTLVPAMVCCLVVPTHYLNQCWYIVNYLKNKLQWNLNQNTTISIKRCFSSRKWFTQLYAAW